MPKECYSNKVWVFWRQGYDNAPDLIKACHESVKEFLPDRDIIFLSDSNIKDYINLPEYITQKFSSGKISEAHYSDIVRISLLAEHGGLWLDSTVYCTGSKLAEKFKHLPLFFFKGINLDRSGEPSSICSNWLIHCYKHNKFIITVRDMLYRYWQEEDHTINYFLFHLLVHVTKNLYPDTWEAIPTFNNISPHILAFEIHHRYNSERFEDIKNMSDFHKLNRHNSEQLASQSVNSGNTFYDEILRRHNYA